MEAWLRILTKIHHYGYPVIGVGGLLVTVVASGPGRHFMTFGPVRLDAFYVGIVSFGTLLILGVADEYDPSDYTLRP